MRISERPLQPSLRNAWPAARECAVNPSTADAFAQRVPLAQRLRIRFDRAIRWEFWPGWLFYIPVIGWIVFCAIRFRHPTAFTAANPGMDNGSVVGERKSQTLLALQSKRPEVVPATCLLPASIDAAMQKIDDWQNAHGWPLVLKPDIGQRGRGVAIIRSREQAQAYLDRATRPSGQFQVLLQTFASGDEYGVFVRRLPGQDAFEISSLTHKALPELRGDGKHSLQELILKDPRARLISRLLFNRHAARLDQVPETGAQIQLVDLGAHCRGSEFRNAMNHISPQLTQKMAEVARAIPGFSFGRIDLRCPSPEALEQAEGLQILEINGVTSEPAHFYHPGTPLWAGIKGFCEHWTRACALGRENLDSGRATAVPPFRLLWLFIEDLRRFDDCEAAAQAALSTRADELNHDQLSASTL